MSDKYKQISCDTYDRLESFTTLQKKLEIGYLNVSNDVITVEIFIKTLVTRNKSEYLVTDLGLEIRLDKLVSIVEV